MRAFELRQVIWLVLGLFAWLAPAADAHQEPAKSKAPGLLIETKDLAARLGDQGLVVVDVRDPQAYGEGHLPGAVNLPVMATFHPERRGDLGTPEALRALLGERGITPTSHVVVYDMGRSTYACRVLWSLHVLGHRGVSLLNGGLEAWMADGLAMTEEPASVEAKSYPAPADPVAFGADRLASLAQVEEGLESSGCALIDARSDREVQAGRIPGAVHIEWTRNLQAEVPRFLPLDELRELYAPMLRDGLKVRAYCRSGQRSTVSYVALLLLGHKSVANYDGAWREWSSDPARPVEK